MRLSIGSAFIAIALVTSGPATAQSKAKSGPAPLATVESVQLSASVERGRGTLPLAPGMELKSGDRVNTGAKSRLVVKLADGSTIKLGEQGSIFFDRMGMRDGKVFEAVIFAAEGAFRLAADTLGKTVAERELSVAVNNVNVGVRGADLWGKSTSSNQIVCLIHGNIEVAPPGETPFTMDQPLSFYALEGTTSRPVATVLPDRLSEWAAETEEEPGHGLASRTGKWKITVASAKKSGEALDVYNALRKAGYAAEIVPAKVGEARVYAVRLSNFESEKDAKFVVETLKGDTGLAKHDYKVGM
jgi:FecR-like protein/sporulation related protein